ncbi:MAG: exodeoxyribonuclease VII large subunit, partial [Thermodesulfobacteriota bacterium]|nr:exodeoxyribonuclease VII large subunit [Thermodesulfobacteriota bacterium]
LHTERHRASLVNFRLKNVNPISYVHKYKDINHSTYKNLLKLKEIYINNKQYRLKCIEGALAALNPMAILQRGYSITRTVNKGKQQVIMNADRVEINQHLEILLAKGLLKVNVQDKFNI